MEDFIFSLLIAYPSLIEPFTMAVKPEDVINPLNRKVYVALDALYTNGKTVDGMNIMQEVGAASDSTVRDHLIELMDNLTLGSASAFHEYLVSYQDEILKHKLAQFGYKLCELPTSSESASDILTEVEGQFNDLIERFTVSNKENPYVSYLDGLSPAGALKRLVPWGVSAMNNLMLGMGPGEMHVLAARPAMGKTTLALNVALKYAQSQADKAVCIYSLEMSTVQLIKKLVSTKTGISSLLYHNNMLTDDQRESCRKAAEDLQALSNLHINDTLTTSIAGIRASIRRIARKQTIGLIVIDYLQLISAANMRGSSTNDKVASISRALKLMAYEFDCPVLVLSQLNREVERRADKRPLLSDLRDSGAIEQDADAVLFLYADSYNQRMMDEDTTGTAPIVLELILAKYRHGSVGMRHVIFDRAVGRFYSPAKAEAPIETCD